MDYEVTIGIPVYKAVDFIKKTMESALNQTFESIEYLVVDDCGDFGEDLVFTYEMITKVRRAVLLSKITDHYLCRSDSLSHYQDREELNKSEILRNASMIDYLKVKSKDLINKFYFPNLYYILEMNSIYTVCYILKYNQRIIPTITNSEIGNILRYPIIVRQIFRFHHRCFQNLCIWGLCLMPSCFSLLFVSLLGKKYNKYANFVFSLSRILAP